MLPLPSEARRDLRWMVERVRQSLDADRRKQMQRIEWPRPGVVWAMDFMEFDPGMAGKIYLHNTQDLSSRYKFLSMAGGYPIREEVAAYSDDQSRFTLRNFVAITRIRAKLPYWSASLFQSSTHKWKSGLRIFGRLIRKTGYLPRRLLPP